MLKGLRRSFFEFRQSVNGLPLAGPRLVDAEGTRIGYIERLIVSDSSMRIEGWADADEIVVSGSDGVTRARPDLARPDVRAHLGHAHDLLGFAMTATGAPEQLILNRNGEELRFDLPRANLLSRLNGEARIGWAFFRLCIRLTPDIMRWARTRDPHVFRRIVAAIRAERRSRPLLESGLLTGSGWKGIASQPITIIMPVYQGRDLVVQAIDRVRKHTDLPWHLVVIDDASPDPRMRPLLEELAGELGPERMTLLSNLTNLGCIGSVNRGFEVARTRGHHVVLLNTDAFVAEGWASRLLAPMLADPQISSVTPMSSNAEIANIPVISVPFTLGEGEVDMLDRTAQKLAGPEAIAPAPTGVGFCMAMNIDMLHRVPQFDPVFGKGYGEEVDWCRKTIAAGGRNVLNAGVFVEHVGGQSFGSEAKRQLMQQNAASITRRYPGYDNEVQDFIQHDPLRTQRLALGLSLAAERAKARSQRLSVFIGHAMKGGAETYLRQRVNAQLQKIGFAVVIRAMPGSSWQFELWSQTGISAAVTDDIGTLESLLAFGGKLRLVYSCGVGGGDPLAIPDFLGRLAKRPDNWLEVTFNDFYPISPSFTLLDHNGVYSGIPSAESPDPAHRYRLASGKTIPLPVWSEHWGRMVSLAGELTVFSESSAEIVRTAWPDLAPRIQVQPHKLPHKIAVVAAAPKPGRPVIGVLGNISGPKGASVLQQLSSELARTRKGKLVLIGVLDAKSRLSPPSVVHGSYKLSNLNELIRKYGISRWFLPSVWPETFCFTAHEMLATGLPVWSFDLGAQAEAVRNAVAKGHPGGVIPLENGAFSMQLLVDVLTGRGAMDAGPRAAQGTG